MTYPFDLGAYSRKVTTRDKAAQRWFDRGLAWTYGYNHDEAVRCFQRAAKADPGCVMAQWGVAYAAGPNYNKQWKAFDVADLKASLKTARKATLRAQKLAHHGTPVERDLAHALQERYPDDRTDRITPVWNDNYAAAMRGVYERHPDDPDVAALFAEAIMNRTPWALWDIATGKPAEGADTPEAIAVLERAMARPGGMANAGILHMYIHLMEMSPHPECALRAADALRGLVPDAGHLQHMPTHIDVLCGQYPDVVTWNGHAMAADAKYVRARGGVNFYTLYRCHNAHFQAYGAMFTGQSAVALAAAGALEAMITPDLLRVESPPMADWLEAFVPTRQHVLIRFGRWQAIKDAPLPADPLLYVVTAAMMLYAKAVAHAATGEVAQAEAAAEAFAGARARVPDSRYLFNNTAQDILAVAAEMMAGEIAYRKGQHDAAFAHLRRAVELDDGLPYDEPWGWMQPARHALGALLLEQGRTDEAAAVYRADLGLDATLRRPCQHPDNPWSLHGLHETLTGPTQIAQARIIRQRLDIARARADVPIEASCFCHQRAMAACCG